MTRTLDQAAIFQGYPSAVRTDQGPEFTGRTFDDWAYRNGVQLELIQPGQANAELVRGKLQRQAQKTTCRVRHGGGLICSISHIRRSSNLGGRSTMSTLINIEHFGTGPSMA